MPQERLECATRDSLMALLDGALALRKSEQTERNPISSRSHAICVLHFGPSGELELPRVYRTCIKGSSGGRPSRGPTSHGSDCQHSSTSQLAMCSAPACQCLQHPSHAIVPVTVTDDHAVAAPGPGPSALAYAGVRA